LVVLAAAAELAVVLIPLGEVIRGGVSTSAAMPTVLPVEEEETYLWRIRVGEKAQLWPPPERNERWMVVWVEYSHGKTYSLDVLAV
jgi:hypothetical protein